MIYFSKVFAFAFTTKLNTLTWIFGSTYFLKLGYLRVTMFGLIEWPFFLLVILVVMTYGFWYPLPRFLASIHMYLLASIEFISGRSIVLFTWVIIVGLVNTICGVATTPIIVIGIPKLLFKFLLVETPPNPQSKLVVNPISIPLLTKYAVGTTTISIHVVHIIEQNGQITSILVGFFGF